MDRPSVFRGWQRHLQRMKTEAPVNQTNLVASDEMLTKEELAPRMKVSVRTIEQWQHDGHLPYLKLGQVVLFYWPEVVKHLTANFTVRRSSQTATDSTVHGGAR